jgi:hypothetical protein
MAVLGEVDVGVEEVEAGPDDVVATAVLDAVAEEDVGVLDALDPSDITVTVPGIVLRKPPSCGYSRRSMPSSALPRN